MEVTLRELMKMDIDKLEIETPDGWQTIREIINKGTQPVYRWYFTNGGFIDCTENHRIETKNRGWQKIKDISEEDLIVSNTCDNLHLTGKPIFLSQQETIDLEIDHPNHRFYANGISVHNSSKGQTHVVSIISGFNYYKERQFDRDEAYMLYVQVSRAAERLYIFDSNYISTADNGTRIPFKNPYFTALRKEITGK